MASMSHPGAVLTQITFPVLAKVRTPSKVRRFYGIVVMSLQAREASCSQRFWRYLVAPARTAMRRRPHAPA